MDPNPSSFSLTPPHTDEEWRDWLRLLRSRRVGPVTFFRLLGEHGSAADALAALPAVAQAAGQADYRPCPVEVAEDELRRGRLAGATPVAFGSPEYPPDLGDIPDPPPFLWVVGDPAILQRPSIGLVGARNASSIGTRMTRALAAGLGEAGAAVVSGFARGIDAAAHAASLKTGTVAVMAGGVDVMYPPENAVLGQEIAETGCLISEQPMGTVPTARHFPRRNRLISGLCRAVVVVEAAAKSGSLITARDALDQGREVLAVPGHPFDARAAGCNMLIRDGAQLVRGPKDVLASLNLHGPASPDRSRAPEAASVPVAAPERRSLRETNTLHQRILDRLGPAPTSEDHLIRDLGLPAATISQYLTRLELDGSVLRDPGGLLRRNPD